MNIASILKSIKSRAGLSHRNVVPYPATYKISSELSYWKKKYKQEGGKFLNSWYRRIMLSMASEQDETFLSDKIVADFGCGPRGSLEWATSAKERIGIDVLADTYTTTFDLTMHSIRYISSTEYAIPLPENYVDILYTINSIDHVDDFECMCKELLRILKPGGDFIGSLNLHEPATPCEPQTLDEELIKKHLLNNLYIKSYRMAPKGPREQVYAHFWDGKQVQGKEEAILWVRATKPG